MHKLLFYNKFIIHLYMFRALCANIIRRPELYYTASGVVTVCRWPSGAQVERGLTHVPLYSQSAHRKATYRCGYQMLYNKF